jgi:molybdopterin-synthase adenylyltransferase
MKKLMAYNKERYSRQIILPEIAKEGQMELLKSKILLIGCGGGGSIASLYLTGAGIGTIGIADYDNVEYSNLHRQIVFTEDDLGKNKADTAKKNLSKHNSDVNVISYPFKITKHKLLELLKYYDFILDCTDGIENKMMINEACIKAKKAFVYGGVSSSLIVNIMTVLPEITCCLRCITNPHNKIYKNRNIEGVLGPLAGIAGCLMAYEAIKYITGNIDALLINKLFTFDMKNNKTSSIAFKRNPKCPVCSEIT